MDSGTQRRMCEFQLLRYVPDAVRNEYVTIGAILREQGSSHAEVRFTRDWRRVRCLDPHADTALLFQHPILHEGCAVTRGVKYALRSDVMYRRP